MSTAAVRGVVRQLVLADDSAGPADAVLLTRYARHRDNAAFAELLRRHGPVVLGVCRRILSSSHDAEDAFQAVFLVLAKRADAIRPAGRVGSWLYGVAVRTANKARVAAARRWRREMASIVAATSRERERPESFQDQAELRSIIDAELGRLPEKYRTAIVVCDLGGRTRSEAARELGCPEGTIAARLHHARKLLADRLTRRGVSLSAPGITAVLGSETVAADLGSRTLAAADAYTSGAASPAVSATVLALAEGMLRTMTTGKIKLMFMLLTGLLLAGGGILWASGRSEDTGQDEPRTPAPEVIVAPAPDAANSRWKETKVLDLVGWLAGSVAYSPDGKALFVGGTEGHVRAYSADEPRQLWEARFGGKLAAVAVAHDGKTLAATIKDGVQFLDPATGKSGDKLEEKDSEPLAVGIFPDTVAAPGVAARKVIFGNGRNYFVKNWLKWPNVSTITSSTVAAGKEPADRYAVPLAVDPSGKRAVVAGPIDPATGRNVLWAWAAGSGQSNEVLVGHKAAVTAAAWSKDGKIIVTGDADGTVHVWDAEKFTLVGNGKVRGKVREEESRFLLGGRVASVAVAPDGMTIAAAVVRPVPGIGQGAYAEEVFVLQRSDKPRGKIIRRLDDNVVEINLGSRDRVEVGLKLTVLPADYPEKGRQSRMRKFRVPVETGSQIIESFVPRARIEVIEVLGPDLSRARITTEYDDLNDRAGAGDLLYDISFQPEDLKPISSHHAGAPFSGVASLAFSPDGTSLASAFCNFTHLTRSGELIGKVRVFSIAAPARQEPKPLGPVTDALFSPDGQRYAVVAGGRVTVHDTADRKRLWDAPADGAGFSPDGKILLVMGPKSVEERDAATGKVVTEHPRPKTESAWQLVSFSPDGKRYAAHFGFFARVYDTATGAELVQLEARLDETGWTIGTDAVQLSWSKDGKHLAAVGVLVAHGRKGAAVWDVASGKRIRVIEAAPNGTGPRSMAFSPDGKELAVCYKHDVNVWTDDTKDPRRVALTGDNTAVAFLPDGRLIVGSEGKFYDGVTLPEDQGYERKLHLHIEDPTRGFGGISFLDWENPRPASALPIAVLAISPDGKFAITGTGVLPGVPAPENAPKAGAVKVWDLAEEIKPAANVGPWRKKAVLKVGQQGIDGVSSATFAPDGKTFAVGGLRGGVIVLNETKFPDSIIWTKLTNNPHPTGVAFSPDGKQVAQTYHRGVAILDATTGKTIRSIDEEKTQPLAIAFGPTKQVQGITVNRLAFTDGKRLWAKTWLDGGEPGTAQFGPLKDQPKIDGTGPAGVAYSPDGEQLVFIPNAKTDPEWIAGESKEPKEATHWYALVWGGGSGKPMRVLPHGTDMVTAVAWSPDGKYLATGGVDGWVVLWDGKSFERVERFIVGRRGLNDIYALAFTPGGKTLAVAIDTREGGRDSRQVALIDTEKRRQVEGLTGFPDAPPAALAFSPDGKTLIVGTGFRDAEIRKLTAEERKKSGAVHVFERKP